MERDVIDRIGAVRREVRTCERDGAPARAVVAERTFDTTVDDVWDAITNPERLPRWFLPVEGDLRLGGRYQLIGNAGGEVTTCDPPAHLAVTWEFGEAVTWLDVHLSEDGDGKARLRLEHVAPVDDLGHWDQFGPGAVGIGWDLGLLGLTEYIRTGEQVSVDADGTADGAGPEFMARSSDAWCEADIASGTPEAEARRRAAATTAAYTGAPEGESSGSPESPESSESPDASGGASASPEGGAPAGGGEPAG